MQNYSTIIDKTTWGIQLNFEGHFTSPPDPPSWLTQLQQQDWQQRGIVLWNANIRVVTHLYAGYVIEIFEHLQGDDTLCDYNSETTPANNLVEGGRRKVRERTGDRALI
jgi:hypothetical protein